MSMNVLDRHGGFTAVTMPRSWAPHLRESFKRGDILHKGPHRTDVNGDTLWRLRTPGGGLVRQQDARKDRLT